MKLIERVKYSLLGKPIKNLLLFLVITLLGAFLSASFSIYQANNNLEKDVRSNLNPVILIEWASEIEDRLLDDVIFLYDKEKDKQNIIEKYRNDERIKIMENRYELYIPSLHFEIADAVNAIVGDANLIAFIFKIDL